MRHTLAPDTLILPTKTDLKKTFEHLALSEVDGVRGVYEYTASRPGPTLAISCLVHGNEPSGLAPLWYFLHNDRLKRSIQNGRILFVANNLKASKRYFQATTEDERDRCRFIDYNMNRIPEEIYSLQNPKEYEFQRMQELCPIHRQADAVIDFHTTSQNGEPLGLAMSPTALSVMKHMPFSKVLTEVEIVQLGFPACTFFGGQDRTIPVFEVESGGHEEESSLGVAIESALQALVNMEMVSFDQSSDPTEYEIYRMVDTLWFPNESYELVRNFPNFCEISKDEVLASGEGGELISPLDGCALFAPKGMKVLSIQEEVMFLSEPPERVVHS
ncbi:MAG: succinylglutamate desuccinylase/aspartoacylase family protein [Bdellovibrionales bacterium]|nr:succinylglutamate desuccinylase/aspartoacylase family protein [Bdellovibrionales bacterium]